MNATTLPVFVLACLGLPMWVAGLISRRADDNSDLARRAMRDR